MDSLDSITLVLAAVTLFVYGLQSFSRELQEVSSAQMDYFLGLATKNRFMAALLGLITTVMLQSSTAVSAIAISLVNTKQIKLKAVLAILAGSYIGTASTAFLISFKLQGIGPYCIIAGTLLSILPMKIRVIGKTIFYFGLIFFALELINVSLSMYAQNPEVLKWLSYSSKPILGVGIGLILAALLQSSSVVIGMAVMFVSQDMLSLSSAITVVLGANIGTTFTAFVASLGMDRNAKMASISNVIFNILGVVIIYPFVMQIEKISLNLSQGSQELAIAFAHLLFNVTVAVIILCILNPYYNWLRKKFN